MRVALLNRHGVFDALALGRLNDADGDETRFLGGRGHQIARLCAARRALQALVCLIVEPYLLARNTASTPNRAAKPIMTKVLVRKRLPLNDARNSCFVAVTIEPVVVWNW